MRKYAAIILAAGFSSRMGQFKPALTIDGETAADRVVALFSRFDLDVYMVVGWRRDEAISGVSNRNIQTHRKS